MTTWIMLIMAAISLTTSYYAESESKKEMWIVITNIWIVGSIVVGVYEK